MKVLLDTNIFIRITDVRTPMPDSYADILRMAHELKFEMVYLKAQIDDMMRDFNVERREINLSRLRQYTIIDDAPQPSAEILSNLGWSQHSPNDEVDNKLLYAVKCSVVHYLVTEDQKIHSKARIANLQEQVLTVDTFLQILQDQIDARRLVHPITQKVETIKIYQLELRDKFFDSLRSSYEGFDKWFRSAAENEREAWVVRTEGKIVGLCIFKIEENERLTNDRMIIFGKILKLCTFKVAIQGNKLGECFLKQAFDFAVINQLKAVYLQVREGEHMHLVSLLEDFGFKKCGRYNNDDVWIKDMTGDASAKLSFDVRKNLYFDIEHYPFHFDGPGVAKYIIPIRPEYHDLLFPDAYGNFLFSQQKGFVFSSEANAIKKAYICNSSIGRIHPSDLLLFYRSGDEKAIDTVGFVERTLKTSDIDKVFAIVASRTVLTDDAIRQRLHGQEALVILFRFISHLHNPISKRRLEKSGILGEIQTIRKLPNRLYCDLIKPSLPKWGIS